MRIALLLLLAMLTIGASVSASAVLAASTVNPGNTVATATSTWFGLTPTGATLCTGANATLACPFGSHPAVGTTVATATLGVKATSTYTLTVVNGTGPAGTGTATAVLAAGASETLDVTLKIKGNTPAGPYSGTITVTDVVSGATAGFPISVTH